MLGFCLYCEALERLIYNNLEEQVVQNGKFRMKQKKRMMYLAS
jgi:hypothetical protein